jgi:tetratricopeptide (TPR) repeat protein
MVLLRSDWDWPGAERHFKRALELDAGHVDTLVEYGMFQVAASNFEEAIALRRRALEMDPLAFGGRWRLGMAYYYARRNEAAIAELKAALAIEENSPWARSRLARAYIQEGLLDEAAAEAQRLLDGTPESYFLPDIADILARSGRPQEAHALLKRIDLEARGAYVNPLNLARVQVSLGQRDQALAELEKAVRDRNADLIMLRVDPVWDPVRNDPRFMEVVRRVRIPIPSAQSP